MFRFFCIASNLIIENYYCDSQQVCFLYNMLREELSLLVLDATLINKTLEGA